MSTVNSVAGQLVGKVHSDLRNRFATDPLSALQVDFGLDVVEAGYPTRRGDGGSCDGLSFLDAETIYFRPTFTDRQYFTLAHELAHFLVERDDDAMDWLTSEPNTGGLLEKVCDAGAGRLLIPDEVIRTLGSSPTAQDIVTLANSTHASRSACIVRAAERLPCAGFIALVDPHQQEVFFASRHEDTRPYAWQGSPVPDAHNLRRLSAGQEVKSESWWPLPNDDRVHYYMNACHDGEWVFAVFSERDLWQITNFHPRQERPGDDRPELTLACPDCGFRGSFRGYPCTDCRTPYCPGCQHCECDRRAARSRLCKSCRLMKAKHLLDDSGICIDCR